MTTDLSQDLNSIRRLSTPNSAPANTAQTLVNRRPARSHWQAAAAGLTRDAKEGQDQRQKSVENWTGWNIPVTGRPRLWIDRASSSHPALQRNTGTLTQPLKDATTTAC